MSTIEVVVAAKQLEAAGIASFELVRADGLPLPSFAAGSHIDVHVPGGRIRQYSLCNDQEETGRYRIAVLRDPKSRGGSAAMHDEVVEGTRLLISAPRNHFPLVHASRTLLFAGGIGITPLLCMAQRLHATSRPFELHYSSRGQPMMAFRREILESPFAPSVLFHFDDGPPEQQLDVVRAFGIPESGTHVYVCGPTGYIDFVVQAAQNAGFQPDNIHTEHFGPALSRHAEARAFDVKLASTGNIITVQANETVVHALAKHGVEITMSCEQGVCGTCVTRVLEGECDHRDVYFSDAEKAKGDQFTPCCSRAKSAVLVLDL